jgi:hypothetical protein
VLLFLFDHYTHYEYNVYGMTTDDLAFALAETSMHGRRHARTAARRGERGSIFPSAYSPIWLTGFWMKTLVLAILPLWQ